MPPKLGKESSVGDQRTSRTHRAEQVRGGADATAFRSMIKKAATMGWDGMGWINAEKQTEFLNAGLDEWSFDLPPHILVAQKFADMYLAKKAKKAVCGQPRSPRLWGRTRDREFWTRTTRCLRWLEPMVSEPNLWKVVRNGEFPERGVEANQGPLMTCSWGLTERRFKR